MKFMTSKMEEILDDEKLCETIEEYIDKKNNPERIETDKEPYIGPTTPFA